MTDDQKKLTMKVDSLRNWEKNPRAIKKDRFDELKVRIQRHGQFKPLIVTPDGEVLGGNMRLRAYRDLGIDDVWVSVVKPKTEAEKVEIALTDNEEMGYYEDQALAELIAQYKDDIDLTKYSVHLGEPQNLSSLLQEYGPEIKEDDIPDIGEGTPDSKYGEVYQLGAHRLMCGDATKREDVDKLMDGKKSDMVFTDPPYNIDYDGSKDSRRDKIANDNMDAGVFYLFLLNSIENMIEYTTGSMYICMGDDNMGVLKKAFENAGGHYQSYIIWVKNKFTLSGADYQNQYEAILYGWKKGGSHYFINDRAQGVVWYEIGKQSKYIDGKTEIRIGTTKLILNGRVEGIIQRGKRKTDVWEYDKPNESKEHPTMKPVKIIAEAIKNSTIDNNTRVLDLFLDSGSTLIACEQTNRICYGMELDPAHCDVIRKRYWKFVNQNEDGWQENTPVITG